MLVTIVPPMAAMPLTLPMVPIRVPNRRGGRCQRRSLNPNFRVCGRSCQAGQPYCARCLRLNRVNNNQRGGQHQMVNQVNH